MARTRRSVDRIATHLMYDLVYQGRGAETLAYCRRLTGRRRTLLELKKSILVEMFSYSLIRFCKDLSLAELEECVAIIRPVKSSRSVLSESLYRSRLLDLAGSGCEPGDRC